MDPTPDPGLRSFVPVPPASHFPIQNLPFGVFRRRPGDRPAVGVALGDYILDLSVMEETDFFDTPLLPGPLLFSRGTLNAFLALGRPAWREARAIVSRLLRA